MTSNSKLKQQPLQQELAYRLSECNNKQCMQLQCAVCLLLQRLTGTKMQLHVGSPAQLHHVIT